MAIGANRTLAFASDGKSQKREVVGDEINHEQNDLSPIGPIWKGWIVWFLLVRFRDCPAMNLCPHNTHERELTGTLCAGLGCCSRNR